MAASGEQIAKAYVAIEADLSAVPAGLNKLSATVTSKILDLQKKTASQMARNKLEMKVTLNAGNMRDYDRLVDANQRLKLVMDRVNQAAVNQATAIRAVNAASRAGTATPRTTGTGGTRSVGGTAFGGGGMGLLMVSQFVDDMQYGFKALTNQIPQVGMALGSALGMGTDAAMKLGGALGIAGVAVNLLINHWDDLMEAMSLGKVLTEAEQMERLAKATKLTADEQERLNRFKRAESAGKELSDKQSSGVAKTEAEIKTAIGEMGDERTSGRSKLIGGLVQARRATGQGTKIEDEEQRQLDIIKRDFGGTKYGQQLEEKLRAKIQTRLDEEDVRRAADTVDKATFDTERRKGFINEIKANPTAFPAGAAAALDIKPSMNTKDQAAADLAKKQAEGLDEDNRQAYEAVQQARREARKNEDERLSGAMIGSVGQSYLKTPGMDDAALQDQVKSAMIKSGMKSSEVDAAAEGVAKKIREKLDEAVQTRALDRGITEDAARAQLAKEAQAKDDKQANMPKSEVMSTSSYLNKVLVAGLSKPAENVAKEQLVEVKKTNTILDGVLKEVSKPQRSLPATFGPGR